MYNGPEAGPLDANASCHVGKREISALSDRRLPSTEIMNKSAIDQLPIKQWDPRADSLEMIGVSFFARGAHWIVEETDENRAEAMRSIMRRSQDP